MAQSRTYTAPALEKGLEVLELLANKGKPMTLAQISTELGRSKSELYRMLAVLEQKKYLLRAEGSDYFHITNRLFQLGMTAPPVGTLIEAAFPVLHELVDATGQPCHLAVKSDQRMVVVARVESPSSVGLSIRVGHSLYLFESGSGHLLLAWLPQAQRELLYAYYAKHCPQFDGKPTDATLQSIRERGFVHVESALVHGVEDIACPIFLGDRKHVIASLTIPYLRRKDAQLNGDKVLAHTQKAAEHLSSLATDYGGI